VWFACADRPLLFVSPEQATAVAGSKGYRVQYRLKCAMKRGAILMAAFWDKLRALVPDYW
jgi:hypothetical protein